MSEPVPTGDDPERVRRLLAAAPPPTMPPEFAARLAAVLGAESRRRSETQDVKGGYPYGGPRRDGLPYPTDRPERPVLITETVPSGPRWHRPAAVALVAAVTTAAVGVAGYTLSATAGLNEPVANSILQVQSSDLAEQARAIAAARNLSAHTFSGAWRCARGVTDGRIVGLTPAVVDGTPALLVYTRTRGQSWVTVVTGCPDPGALARTSARLS